MNDDEVLSGAAAELEAGKPTFDYPMRIRLERSVFAMTQEICRQRVGYSLQSLLGEQIRLAEEAAAAKGDRVIGDVLVVAVAVKELIVLAANTDPYVAFEDCGEFVEGHPAIVARLAVHLRRFVEITKAHGARSGPF